MTGVVDYGTWTILEQEMKEKEILTILDKINKKIDQLPEPSSAKEAHNIVDLLENIYESLERLEQRINPQ